jgi:excinuclease UvrABC nuclease subunit
VSEETYNLDFQGYWRKPNADGIPDKSGIYCVYECKYNPEPNTVTLIYLLYIGQAKDVKTRILSHEKLEEFEKYARKGTDNNEICFTFASVEPNNLDRVEAALIFKHKPPFNDYCAEIFESDKTTIKSTGAVAFLNTDFVVEKGES